MDEAELGVFIYQLGFPQYSPMFVQKCITGADLADPDLCDEDLKDDWRRGRAPPASHAAPHPRA